MRKQLLLAATLGAFALLPASASAEGYGSNVVSSFGLSIVVRDGPKVIHHPVPRRHLKPQPWPRHLKYHAPPKPSWHYPRWHQPRWHYPRWHQPRWQPPRHHPPRDFRVRDGDRRHHVKDDHGRRWSQSRHHRYRTIRGPHGDARHRDRRAGFERHR